MAGNRTQRLQREADELGRQAKQLGRRVVNVEGDGRFKTGVATCRLS
jgi:hypothetical protein